MSLTLVEAAKQAETPYRSGIIEYYARSSEILRTLPFQNISGNALKYNREETLPGIGFRGVNEGYTESTGIINPQTETLAIAGGDLDVDKFIIDTMGSGQRSVQEAMKIKALALSWTKHFIKGDSVSDPKSFDGLQVRLTGDQLTEAGSTDGGDALSLLKLDEFIDSVEEPSALIMSQAMARRFYQAARTTTVGGYITFDKNEFGYRVGMYNDLPFLVLGKDNENNDILGFNEVGSGGATATATSIYCVSFGDGKLTGIQNGGIDVRDIGELEAKPSLRTRVEWYAGIAMFHGRAAARMRGIKNAAIVA